MSNTKISIIIPCYNGEPFLESSIESVLNQTHKNFILYLIDNGSTDNSLKIMQYYKKIDKRIQVIKNIKRTSRGKSINLVVKKCKTKYIAFLDADDLMFKRKIEKQLKYLKKYPKIDVLSTLCNYINLDNNKSFGKSAKNLFNHHSCFDLINKNKVISIVSPSVVIKKDVFLKNNGFREEYWPVDDSELWTRLAQNKFCVYSIPEILLSYRVHKHSITTSKFFHSRLKNLWVKENLILRKKKKKEINYKYFLYKYNQKSIFFKIRERVNVISDNFFRISIINIINKEFINLVFILMISFLFSPNRFLKKVIFRLKKV